MPQIDHFIKKKKIGHSSSSKASQKLSRRSFDSTLKKMKLKGNTARESDWRVSRESDWFFSKASEQGE